MAIKDIGPLLGADEGLNHQIVDTFATLSQTDMAWTEKIWASIAKTDGSLQVDFGLRKYQNRGIMTASVAYPEARSNGQCGAAVSWPLRLRNPRSAPIHLEIVEPLKQIRFRLEPNDVQPISFDIVLSAVTPPFFEERVAGEVYEMAAPQDATPERIRRMCLSMADQLAAIHTVDLSATGLDSLAEEATHLDRELDHWAGEMHRVQRGSLPALERLLEELRATKPQPCPTVTLVHGDAKPGNFAFVGDEVSAVFDWEMTTVGDPLTDIGWMELLWMQPVGITSHPSAPTIDDFLARYEEVSGISTRNREWYRALNAFKMAVICLIGSMLFDDGVTDDQRFLLNAHGISLLTQVGLADLGISEKLEDGPVMPRDERIRAVQAAH